MFVVHDYAVAVLLCVVTMLCWGSWSNTMKIAGPRWRFELFYWDYTFGTVLFAAALAFTFGSLGTEGRPFLADLRQAQPASLVAALLGGVVFNAANILVVAAIDIAGMAVAFPVGIGLALVVGVGINYWNQPEGSPALLGAGVASVLLAIVLDAWAYRRLPGQSRSVSTLGLVLAVVGGVLMGTFYLLVVRSLSPEFTRLAAGKLGPYAAVFLLTVGILASNIVFNTLLMARPFRGQPVTFADYARGSAGQHLLGLVGGAVWCVGTSLSILASEAASPAVSYGLGQGATMIAAAWGVFVWREFRAASPGTKGLLALMFAAYLAGLALLVATRLP